MGGEGGGQNRRKDQLTTHSIFRDALAGREIRLNGGEWRGLSQKLPHSFGSAINLVIYPLWLSHVNISGQLVREKWEFKII